RRPDPDDRGAGGEEADLRDLPGAPAARPGAGSEDLQAEIRPPGRQPPRRGPEDRDGRDHVPEPRVRRGRPDALFGGRADTPELERRNARGIPAQDPADPGGAVPPGGLSRPPRRQRALRKLHRGDGGIRLPASGGLSAPPPGGGPRLPALTALSAGLLRVPALDRGDRPRGRGPRRGDGPSVGIPP